MQVDFRNSVTKENLMRAFAGESQARNRYTFASEQAQKQNMPVLEAVFKFTADQEKMHAQVFYDHLKEVSGENIHIDGAYPVDIKQSAIELLRLAQHNEYEEHGDVYPAFAQKAKEEGFPQIASSFSLIAEVEKIHGDRFAFLADLVEKNQLYVSECQTGWMCMKCGYVYEGLEPPKKCPVCQADQAFFIRLELTPYTTKEMCKK